MKISKLAPKPDMWYQDYNFLSFFETHLSYLQGKISSAKDIPEAIAHRYRGDFYGLLRSMKVPMDLHYITLRLNGFTNSADFTGEALTVLLPNESELLSLKNVYSTNKTSKK